MELISFTFALLHLYLWFNELYFGHNHKNKSSAVYFWVLVIQSDCILIMLQMPQNKCRDLDARFDRQLVNYLLNICFLMISLLDKLKVSQQMPGKFR